MRGNDGFMEQLFTMKRLEDFVPADHLLRSIRLMVNVALVRLDGLVFRHARLQCQRRSPQPCAGEIAGPCCCRCSTASVRSG